MDISALLGASTATAPSALSFGVMGGGIGNGPPSGEGLEGLDGLESFNQLLGNFLSLTGADAGTGDGTAMPVLTTDEVPGGLTLGTGGPTVPSGLGALLGGGFNLTNMAVAASSGNGAKGIEARWAQSGISLLANGSLSGQEMNPEVVAFLNDLSQAFNAASPLTDGEAVIDDAVQANAETEDGAVDILMALQGGTGTDASLVVQVTQVTIASASANSNAPVIPVMTTDTASSALGVNLTVAGTGLKALPTQADTSLATTVKPAAPPVIPKLDATMMTAATSSAANMAAPVDTAPTSSPAVEQKAVPVAAPQHEAVSIKAASPSTPSPSTAPAAPVVTGTVAATGTEITPATDTADEKPGAIALPTDLAATASGDEKASVKEMAAAKAASTTTASATTVSAAGQASVNLTEPKAPAPAPAPAPAITAPASAAPASTASVQESTDKPAVTPASGNMTAPSAPATAASPTPATSPTPAAASSTKAQTVFGSEPAPAETTILTASALPAEPAAEAEADPAMATTANSPTPHTVTLRTSSTAAPTAAARPAPASTRPAADANAAPVEGEDVKATEAVSDEDEAVTNNRMLAPKHVGNEARAEMQADMAGSAQSAGQNQPATRVDTTVMRAETEDNLLSRAISAGAKGHESGSSTDGSSQGGSGFAEAPAADGIDPASAGLHTGDNGKVQGNDFAQSLRQTSAPHRPNAYTPPGQQMAFHVQRAVQDGNDRVSIQLNPYEMGRIDVQLEIGSEGKLRAKVMVENPATLEMLQKDAKNLEKALQEAGLQTDGDSLTFSLQDSGDQAQQRQDHQDQSGYGTGFASDDVEDEDPAIIAQAQIMEFGRVDVRV
jgi:flagellar hook-length control protein FliK